MILFRQTVTFILFSIPCFAGEVDPYLVWGHPLNDASDKLNWYYNHEIQVALQKLPEDCSCQTAAASTLRHFGVTLNGPLEKRIKSTNWVDKFPKETKFSENIFRKSIYWEEGSSIFEKGQSISLDKMIDEIININGILTGIDKLTHFTGSGYLYYIRYTSLIEKGESIPAAMEKAVRLGIFGEQNLLGRYASGVFSFADLEANFQGLLFGIDLCEGHHPLLKKVDSKWILNSHFDIRNYVNPNWDEAFNPSYYYEGQNLTLLKKSKTVLNHLPSYCIQFQSPEVQARFNHYEYTKKISFSALLLQKMIYSGEIPDPTPFNIQKICSESNSH